MQETAGGIRKAGFAHTSRSLKTNPQDPYDRRIYVASLAVAVSLRNTDWDLGSPPHVKQPTFTGGHGVFNGAFLFVCFQAKTRDSTILSGSLI